MVAIEGANGEDGYGWFSPPDLDLLFAALNKLNNPSDVVLVGGQSLSFWVDRFHIPIPQTETPYLTQDADFLATRADAMELAKHIGGKLRLATLADASSTTNTATLVFDGVSGEKLLIDFLGVVTGLSREEVKGRAVPVERNGQLLYVLHPLLCLNSRICNLRIHKEKRNRNGVEQARVAVEVVRHYISERLNNGETRGALNAAQQIAKYAQSKAGIYVWERFQIDVLEAVVPDDFPSKEFREIGWPAQVKKTNAVRERNENRKRQQEEGRASYSPKSKKYGPSS